MIALGTTITLRKVGFGVHAVHGLTGVLGQDDDGCYTLQTHDGYVHRLCTDLAAIEAVRVRTAEEIAADRATAVRQIADDLAHAPAAATLLVGFLEGRDLTPHGSVGVARTLERRGLIAHDGTIGVRRTLHAWRLTETGREVAALVQARRWATSCGRMAS